MCSSAYLYILFVTTELLCCQSRVLKPQVQLAYRAIYLCDNRDPNNQGHAFFFVLNFELTSFSDGQLSKVSARPTVFNWENIERESVPVQQ